MKHLLNVEVLKIASCSVDDWPLLEEVCKINKKRPTTFNIPTSTYFCFYIWRFKFRFETLFFFKENGFGKIE